MVIKLFYFLISYKVYHIFYPSINDQNNTQAGNTGSEIENEANAKAGVIMRKFGKMHSEIYK